MNKLDVGIFISTRNDTNGAIATITIVAIRSEGESKQCVEFAGC